MDLGLLSRILQDVEKPSQYLGNEVNAVHKDFAAQTVRVALVFPDAYEIGMSHMGLKILYDILNNIEGVVAERCFAPGKDFEAKLREHNLPLTSLESKTPLSAFDVIGITLPYELTYTNILNVLDLGGIPLWQKDRGEKHPIVLGGGTGSYNPEPVADFFDVIAIGDGEELILEFVSKIIDWKRRFDVNQIAQNTAQGSRAALLDELKNIEGLYIPSFFVPEYHDDGTLRVLKALKPGYESVKKRVVSNLDDQPYPTKLVLPNIQLVHDRIGIEIQRGCTRMCRFCQAGYIERPTRQRSPERVLEIADKSYEQTGINEISLLSLSAGDYQTIVPTLKKLNARYAGKNVSISVPATRTETLTPELIAEVKKVRKTGFTIAPEAGTERMRRVINKGNKTEDLMQACRNAFSAGYRLIKFYYLCGIPFEHDEDLTGIAEEARQALGVGLEHSRSVEINVSVSTLVPKPFTPFQWDPQITVADTQRRHEHIRRRLGDKRLRFKCHKPEMSFLEGVFSRGDRRLSLAVHRAFENGCRFDEWEEHLDFAAWQKTFAETGTDTDFYLHRTRSKDELLPWDHLFSQMQKEWLWQERENARLEAYRADCSIEKCADFCGACDFKTIKNRIYVIDEKPLAAKKGNREWYGRFGAPQPEIISNPETPLPVATPQPIPLGKFKCRVHFSKTGFAALMGHSELMNHLRRAILRTGAPVVYSEGFHPQMRLSLGYALPLGLESECESFDLLLRAPISPESFLNTLNAALPQGISAFKAENVDLKSPSLYSITESVLYRVALPRSFLDVRGAALQSGIERLRAGQSFPFIRSARADKASKSFDLSRVVAIVREEEEIVPEGDNEFLEFMTVCDAEGSIRPSEVLMALSGVTNEELSQLQVRKIGVRYREFATGQSL